MTAATATPTATPPVALEGGLGSAAPPKRASFAGFDGLRAIAALAVLVTHATFTSGANIHHSFGAFFARLDAGVSIFFCISGFLLYRPYVAARRRGAKPLGFSAFMRRRVLRIFPAYWVALTVVVFVLGHETIGSISEAVTYYGLLQIYDPDLIGGGIGQAWSLCTEMSYYLFVPAYAALLRRAGRGFGEELFGLAALVVVAAIWKLGVLGIGGAEHMLTWLPAYLDLFALGMFLAVVSVWKEHRTSRWLDATLGRAWIAWTLAATTFFLVATQFDLPRALEGASSSQQLWRHGLYGLTGFFLIAPAVLGTARGGGIRKFLEWRPMAVLGLISYGIYLWHKAVITEVQGWLRAPLFDIDLNRLLGWTLIATIAISAVSYALVERPALRYKTPKRSPGRGLGAIDVLALAVIALLAYVLGPLSASAEAPPPPPAAPAPGVPVVPAVVEKPVTILLLGDSLLFDSIPAVEAALSGTGRFHPASSTGPGVGLAHHVGFDWRSEWGRMVSDLKPGAVLLHVGAWDATTLMVDGQLLSPRDEAWQRMYRDLLVEAESVLTRDGAHLYLMGSPDLRDRDRTDEVIAYNRLLRNYSAGRANVTFIDTFSALEERGGTDGLRKNDGVHLCPPGAARVAEVVLDAVNSATSAASDAWLWSAWRHDLRYADPSAGCDAWVMSPRVR